MHQIIINQYALPCLTVTAVQTQVSRATETAARWSRHSCQALCCREQLLQLFTEWLQGQSLFCRCILGLSDLLLLPDSMKRTKSSANGFVAHGQNIMLSANISLNICSTHVQAEFNGWHDGHVVRKMFLAPLFKISFRLVYSIYMISTRDVNVFVEKISFIFVYISSESFVIHIPYPIFIGNVHIRHQSHRARVNHKPSSNTALIYQVPGLSS